MNKADDSMFDDMNIAESNSNKESEKLTFHMQNGEATGEFRNHDSQRSEVATDSAHESDKQAAFNQNDMALADDETEMQEAGMFNGGDPGLEQDKDTYGDALSEDIAMISRQASQDLEKNLGFVREITEDLFSELNIFLRESANVERDFQQVQMTVHAESARLDELQPQVESATMFS